MPSPPSRTKTTAHWSRALPVQPRLLGLVLAGVTLLVFWPVARCDFVSCDDGDYYTSNWTVLGGVTLDGLWWALTTGHAANWHPLTWLSLMLDAQLFGPSATGPHVTNLLFHVANAVLLFSLFVGLTGSAWASLLVAALFALHPLHVESVAWISERKDVLSMFFFLLALIAYVRYANTEARLPGKRRGLLYASSLLLFALGLMSKPMVVTLPFVMLLLDYWPLQRWPIGSFRDMVAGFKRLGQEKLPFFALSAASSAVTLVVQARGGAVGNLASVSLDGRAENAVVSFARYLGKTLWPVDLCVLYPHPGHWGWSRVASAAALVAGITLMVWGARRRFPYLVTGWFWFLGTLVPVLGLVQVGVQSMADRYTYLPLIGVFIILAWGAKEIAERTPLSRVPLGIMAAGVLLACTLVTRAQIGYWKNGETLFRHAVDAVEKNDYAFAFLQNDLGTSLYRQGRVDEAGDCFRKALQAYPRYELAQNNLGLVLIAQGRLDEALSHYARALELDPGYANAHVNMGDALVIKGRIPEAITHYRQAVNSEPRSVAALNNLGAALARQGQYDEAIECYRKVSRLAPRYSGSYKSLGNALAHQGRLGEAEANYLTAIRLDLNNAEIHYLLGTLFARQQRTAEAAAQFTEALRLKPDYSEASLQLHALTNSLP